MRSALILAALTVMMLIPAAAAQTARIGEKMPEITIEGWSIETADDDDRDGDRDRGRHGRDSRNEATLPDDFEDYIVVLYFFRTDDPTSMEYLETVEELHDEFRELGVQFLALSGETKEQGEERVEDRPLRIHFAWVGHDWVTRICKVAAYPQVYLLDTSGVLVSRFHPGDDMAEKIRQQMRRTPPASADPQTINERFALARAALAQHKYGQAYTHAAYVERVTDDESDRGREVDQLLDQIEEGAAEQLREAREAARREDYDRAAEILAEIAVRFRGRELSDEAELEIGRLMGNRELKPLLNRAHDEAEARLAFERAVAAEQEGRYLTAVRRYRAITADYGNTDTSEKADEAVTRIQDDPAAQRAIRRILDEEQAERWLEIAERFSKVKMHAKARVYLQRILDELPDTRSAPKARAALKDLPAETPKTAEK
jgi:hypothetical protein